MTIGCVVNEWRYERETDREWIKVKVCTENIGQKQKKLLRRYFNEYSILAIQKIQDA